MEGDFWTFVHPSGTGVATDSVSPFQTVNIKEVTKKIHWWTKQFHHEGGKVMQVQGREDH